VPANGSATVDVTITANAGLPARSVYGGYIAFTPEGGGADYRVPYAGMKGDYQSVTVLVPTANQLPLLARLGEEGFDVAPAGSTFTLADGDVPFVLAHFEHQSQIVRLEVLEAVGGKSWHRGLEIHYLGRNSTATGFFGLPWDGVTVAGNRAYEVPNGSYILRLSVLKPLGDAANPAHWETWDSPAFNIARP
jgi:minor extracellular serine protease Vpr